MTVPGLGSCLFDNKPVSLCLTGFWGPERGTGQSDDKVNGCGSHLLQQWTDCMDIFPAKPRPFWARGFGGLLLDIHALHQSTVAPCTQQNATGQQTTLLP